MVVPSGDRWEWSVELFGHRGARASEVARDEGRDERVVPAPCERWRDVVSDDERLRALDDVATNPLGDALQRLLSERLLAAKNARTGDGPVDAIGGRSVRRQPKPVSRGRPDNRLAVPASHKEQASPLRGRSVMGGVKHPPVDRVTVSLQLLLPRDEELALPRGDGFALAAERPPGQELGHVLEEHNLGASLLDPLDH